MRYYEVEIQHDNKWIPFKTYYAENGEDAMKAARQDTELLNYFSDDEIATVNMDYHDVSDPEEMDMIPFE